jgi:hypothetical protein
LNDTFSIEPEQRGDTMAESLTKPDSFTESELQIDWDQFAAQENQRIIMNWIVGSLLVVGILLVLFAEALGTLSAENWKPSAPWYPEEAHAAANTFRAVGLMLFLGGIAERIVLVVRSQQQQSA